MSADGVLKAISSLYQTSSSEEDEQEENVPALTLKRKCNTRNEGGGEEEKQKKLCSNEWVHLSQAFLLTLLLSFPYSCNSIDSFFAETPAGFLFLV